MLLLLLLPILLLLLLLLPILLLLLLLPLRLLLLLLKLLDYTSSKLSDVRISLHTRMLSLHLQHRRPRQPPSCYVQVPAPGVTNGADGAHCHATQQSHERHVFAEAG